MGYRINVTKVRCPCCSGGGKAPMLGIGCQWCGATGRLSPAKAERFADLLLAIGRGGYIAGDHDLADCRAMEIRAAEITAFLKSLPSPTPPLTTAQQEA